jgi:hypothetical protein
MWAYIDSNSTSTRSVPAKPVVLKSSQLELILDGKDGLPYEYRLQPSGIRMRGEDFGNGINAVICDRKEWKFLHSPITVAKVTSTEKRGDFHFQAANNGEPAATFVLRYALEDATVRITLEDIQELNGYELIQLELPDLVTVREEDENAWLVHGDSGGSFAFVKEAKPGQLPANTFWGDVAATLPVIMLGTDRALCIQEVTAYMDGTALAVVGPEGKRRACMGTVQTHRVNGSLSYDMNTGKDTPRVSGNRQTPNLLVEQKSSCRLDFIATPNNQKADWITGAALVRSRMPEIPTHYYDNKLIYGIRCDEPTFEKPVATFAQCEELTRAVAALTGNWPQVVHLWGWQYRGKDTGYPAVAEVNKRLGTYDDLMQLMERARQYNCTITFSDNYDDAYKSSPAWDTKYIARRPDGELWESRNWTGENSYIIGLAKYMKGPGLERVRYTCERYKLRETTHVDVLSYFSVRNDWDAVEPASGIKNLFEGRYKVLEEFAKHGIDVSSEMLRYAFIGKVSYFWNMPNPTPCPFGGKPIPLSPTIYRHSAIWGESGRNRSYVERILSMLFYNAYQQLSLDKSFQYGDVTDIFYLMMVPWFQVRNRKVESFRREGEHTLIGLEGNSLLKLDWQNKTYKITLDGVEVASDGSTYCPLGKDRIAFYSVEAKELSITLPKGWNPAEVTARLLTTGEPQPAHMTITGQTATVQVPARQPVVLSSRQRPS